MFGGSRDETNILPSDWERVVIIHSRDDSNMWAPSRALLSAHSGYNNLAWGDIQNTLTTDQINAGDAKDPNGVQNEDHPKVYVAWSKHPNFDTRNTGFTDPASQSLDDAYRSDDWWYYVDPQYYVRPNVVSSGSILANISRSDLIIAPRRVRPLERLIGGVLRVTRRWCRLASVMLRRLVDLRFHGLGCCIDLDMCSNVSNV